MNADPFLEDFYRQPEPAERFAVHYVGPAYLEPYMRGVPIARRLRDDSGSYATLVFIRPRSARLVGIFQELRAPDPWSEGYGPTSGYRIVWRLS